MDDIMIDVAHLSKCYKLYEQPIDRMKEALNPLHHSYHKDFYALQDVSFSVHRGEIVGIIGKNGSGKSTLLKMITGVLTPSGGTKVIKGRVSALLELGAGFNPEYTGIENIYMNGTIMGYTHDEMAAKVASIVSFADIGDFIHQPVKMYSSGMFARLAFAVAINVEPDVLIVDEALSVGDVFFQNKCFRRFEALRRAGVTILFVSHDMTSIRQLTSRVLWLEHGSMRMFDITGKVCDMYDREQMQEQNRANKEARFEAMEDKMAKVKNCEERLCLPELPDSKEGIKSPDVRIRSLQVLDKDGQRVSQLKTGCPYRVDMAVEFKKPLLNIIFGFVLENSKGVQILSINSYIDNEERVVAVSKPGIVVTSFSFVLPKLMKGEYLLSPAVAQGVQQENVVLTWLTGAVKIMVENYGYNISLLEIPAEVNTSSYSLEDVVFH